MPKVSVLIPHYGHQAYIMDAVQSILNQTFQDFEILILNDDPEADLDTMQFWNDKIRVLNTDAQIGQPAQLNIGVKESLGDYIAFQDADDLSFPYRLEYSLNVLGNDGWFVYGDKVFLYPNGRQVYWKSPEFHRFLLHKRPMGCWGSYMVKRNVFYSVKFDPDVKWGNDHIWEAGVSRIVKPLYIDLPLYYQRTYSSQYRNSRIPVYRKIRRKIIERRVQKRVKAITGAP